MNYEQTYHSDDSWKPVIDVQADQLGLKAKDINTNNNEMAKKHQGIQKYDNHDNLQTSSSLEITNKLTPLLRDEKGKSMRHRRRRRRKPLSSRKNVSSRNMTPDWSRVTYQEKSGRPVRIETRLRGIRLGDWNSPVVDDLLQVKNKCIINHYHYC